MQTKSVILIFIFFLIFNSDYAYSAHIYQEKIYQNYWCLKTQEIDLLICIWKNKFADKIVDFATCVDKTGKRYNIELDDIRRFEDDFEK